MSLDIRNNKSSPAWQIVEYLQRNGAATIKDLEEMLGITTTAVRQHLSTLQAGGYVARRTVHAGVGRPHHTYSVTENVRELFACHCDDLALTLLEEMFQMEGPQKVAALLERVGGRLANRYAGAVKSSVLRKRVEEMASVLDRQGVLTDVDARDDETVTLRTYNCPYHELAQEHREICTMDQEMMQQVLGSDVILSACIMDGDSGCTFVVSTKQAISLEP
jgi:predicted ArsR family transcriptional regulator